MPPGKTREQWQDEREAEIARRLRELQEQATWIERVARVQSQGAPPEDTRHV